MARKVTYTITSARDPDGSRAELLSRAEALFAKGATDKADALYARVLDADPDNIPALVGKAVTGSRLRGDPAEALAFLDHAAALDPGNSHIPQTRAAILNEMGAFDDAVDSARHALSLNPLCALAYVNLTDSLRVAPGDPVFDLGETALAGQGLSDADRVLIHFALGKAFQDCGDWDRAFGHFDTGNRLKPAPEPVGTAQGVATRQKTLFSRTFARGLTGAAKTNPRPIFIVGMPRSGTTLLERMLAAHPEVSTAGERRELNHLSSDFYTRSQAAMPDIAPDEAIRRAMNRGTLAKLARTYVTPVARAADHPRANVIDKMPTNFWNIGLIVAIFADAPILHMRRHPLDTCLSNYIANFRTGLTFSNRLDTLGQYYRIYVDIMCYWADVFPDRIVQVDYETLVSEPEAEARRILDRCGLDWHNACLHPDRTEGVIATASRWQARQKINTGSVEKWRRYAAHLGPLIDALGGMDWITAHEAARLGRPPR